MQLGDKNLSSDTLRKATGVSIKTITPSLCSRLLQTPILMSAEAFALNFPSWIPYFVLLQQHLGLNSKMDWGGGGQKLVQYFSRIKSCCLSPKYYCFICLLLHYQQSNVSKATILPTASSQGSCDHHLSIHHQRHLRFRFLPALILCILYKADLIFRFAHGHSYCPPCDSVTYNIYGAHQKPFPKNPPDMSGLFLIEVMSSWKWFSNPHRFFNRLKWLHFNLCKKCKLLKIN